MTALADQLSALDATAQAALVAGGELRPSELVAAAIARIERLDPTLNAVIHRRFERALAEAAAPGLRGPFAGVPLLLKDAVAHSAGDPYHVGMRLLMRHGYVARGDTDLVRRFRDAGFVLVGRTNTPELAGSYTTEPEAYGAKRNPWDLTRSPGGSSGGSAAAVAARLTPLAHGNDMGGSIRVPAAACGVIGLKPSHGRTSLGPDLGELQGPQGQEGLLGISVRDVAAVLDAVSRPSPGDPVVAPPPPRPFADLDADLPALRVGVLAHVPGMDGGVAPRIADAVARTAELLEARGHRVEEGHPDALGDFSTAQHAGTVFGVSVARQLAAWERELGVAIGPDDVEPSTWMYAELGRAATGVQYVESVEALHRWGRALAGWWAGGFDLLLTPTLPVAPPALGHLSPQLDPQELGERSGAFLPFVFQHNVSGQPAISLPAGHDDEGLPIGVQLVAAYGREDLLLGVAAQLEAALDWASRRPPLAV